MLVPERDGGVHGSRGRAGDGVGHHQVAAGRQGVKQTAHDAVRVVVIADEVHDPEQGEGDWLGEVERLGGLGEDRTGVVQIGIDVGGGALRVAGEKGTCVDQDERVVVDVDDA